MAEETLWEQCVRKILTGERVDFDELVPPEARQQPLRIRISQLAAILIGRPSAPSPNGGGEPRLHCGLDLTTTATVQLNGGGGSNIHIVPDESDEPQDDVEGPLGRKWSEDHDRIVSLSNLSSKFGGALPPLVLRNCVIHGWLDISGSHFASVTLDRCNLRGLQANGAQIDGDCILRQLRPIDVPMITRSLKDEPGKYCQVRMISARVDGSVDLRDTLLRSRRLDEIWPEMTGADDIPAQHYTEQFALSLASSEINGRIQLLGDFEAWGGLSLFQAEIHNSIRISSRMICAHEAREFPNNAVMHQRQAAALDLCEIRLKGTFTWVPEEDTEFHGVEGNVYGRVELIRATIDGDVNLQNLRWLPLGHCLGSPRTATAVAAPYRPGNGVPPTGLDEPYASGGIDGRYAQIRGQLRIGNRCRIGRRYRPMSGHRLQCSIGPALDFWKASFDLGLRIESGSILHGAIHLNVAKIGRQLFIASDILIDTAAKPRRSPYHMALDLADARIDGYANIRIGHVGGRVTLERVQVNGSLQIEQLGFSYSGTLRGDYSHPDDDPPIKRILETRERFDETSILDMQDLTVIGGVNLKRESVSVHFDKMTRPHNNFIVDLRGMTSTTWDDADGTCWNGLNLKDREDAVPWRLRMDGIIFARLDTSNQPRPLAKGMVRGVGKWRRWWHLLIDPFYRKRSWTVASMEEVAAFRKIALESFHENRNYQPSELRVAEEPYRYQPTEGLSWLWRLRHHVERWTLLPSWKRRELIPPFSPQPYEMFARAYMARGETDTAIRIGIERMRRQWRRRIRLWSNFWTPFAVMLLASAIASAVVVGVLAPFTEPPFTLALPACLAVAAIGPPIAMRSIIGLWRLCFGYGLRSGRALATVAAFFLFTSFATPMIVGEPGSGDRTRDFMEHAFYGIDKLIPFERPEQTLYPENVVCTVDGGVQQASVERQAVTHHRTMPTHPCRFRYLDGLYDMLAWIILSLTALTFSGLFRREIERTSSGG